MSAVNSPSIDAANRGDRQPVVMQVLPALVTGGVERGTVDVAAALVAAGWKSIVVSAGGPMVRELERAGAQHVTLPVNSKNPLVMRRNTKALVQLIEEHGVDVVHARSRAPAHSALAAARKTGAHFVTTFHGTYNRGPFNLKDRYNRVMTEGERVIAISDFIADHMQTVYGTDPSKIRVIHRGIDTARFTQAAVSAERIIQLAQKWRLPDGYRVIMLPGRLTRWKGQTVLIQALSLLGRRDVRCLLVGSDQGRTEYSEELQTLADRLGLTDIVHLVGDCNDMAAAYMLTDVVVSASTDPEAFGRVVVEAQAMGRPVIATDHGGARETVLAGETGLLVPPKDPQALAVALDEILSLTPGQREELAVKAEAHVRGRFAREVMCAKTLDVYREVLGREVPGMDASGVV